MTEQFHLQEEFLKVIEIVKNYIRQLLTVLKPQKL